MEPAVRTVSDGLAVLEDSIPDAVAATIQDEDDDDAAPANVEQDEDVGDEDSDYSSEEDDDAYVSSFLQGSAVAATSNNNNDDVPATIEDEPAAPKWREPTRQAVDMSLRAEQETKGGKRRLLQDLYRIMNQDTHAAGFSLEPTNYDSMEQWTIKLFQFDQDSNLAKDMIVLGIPAVELNMSFPDDYPFSPPFVRVTCPRFKKQTGFVMNGAICMELLTQDGWNPVNDIESVIVSIRSLLVVGDGRLEAAASLSDETYAKRLVKAQAMLEQGDSKVSADKVKGKRQRVNSAGDDDAKEDDDEEADVPLFRSAQAAGTYSATEAEHAYAHLSDFHKKKGWDNSGWWAKKG